MTMRATLPPVACLLFLTVVIRLGSLTQTIIIYEDEFTFGLMAQDVLRGHLPYVHAFDNKPPGLFLILAGFFYFFGSNFLSLRLFGDFSVFFCAVLTFLLLRKRYETAPSLLAASLVVAFSGLDPMLGTYSQWPAMAFILGALLVAVSNPASSKAAFFAGLLFAFAALIRLNLAYAGSGAGAAYLIAAARGQVPLHAPVALALGAALPCAGLAAVYAANGAFDLLVLCGIKVPLSYSRALPFFEVLKIAYEATAILYSFYPAFMTFFSFSIVMGVLLSGVAALRKETACNGSGRAPVDAFGTSLIAWVCAATASTLFAGVFYPHYLIQILPFLVIPVAAALHRLSSSTPRLEPLRVACIVAVVVIIAQRAAPFAVVASDPGSVLRNSEAQRIADFIEKDGSPEDTILAASRPDVLFILNRPQVTRFGVHFYNLWQPSITRPLIAAGYIGPDPLSETLERRPRYVIVPARFIEGAPTPLFALDVHEVRARLARHYRLVLQTETTDVMRLN